MNTEDMKPGGMLVVFLLGALGHAVGGWALITLWAATSVILLSLMQKTTEP